MPFFNLSSILLFCNFFLQNSNICLLTNNYQILTFFDKLSCAIMNIFVKWKMSGLNIYIVVI